MSTPPPSPPAQDFIRYDLLTQKALRGVVHDVLVRVSREGAPGDHHFYISFRTTDPDVKVSSRLRQKYPAEMTIVLQHQFWDLEVRDDGFEVGLSFQNIPEKLVVPFASITGFFDPSVQFGLKFDNPEAEAGSEEAETSATIEPLNAPEPAAAAESADDSDKASPPEGGAEVVSLDKFRKK